MFRQRRFPRRPTRGVCQNVSLTPNPDPHQIVILQIKRPIGHLLAPTTVIKLGLRKDVVLVIDVTIHLKPPDQPIVRQNPLPQGVEFALHRRPPLLNISETLCHDGHNLRRPMGNQTLTEGSCPAIVARIHEHFERTTRLLRSRRRLKVNMMQYDITTQVATNLKERFLIFRVLKPNTEITPFLPKGTKHLLVLDPLRTHILSEIVDETQEGVQGSSRIRFWPRLELINLLWLDRPSAPVQNTTPKLDGWLIELTFRETELQTALPSRRTQGRAVSDMLLEGPATNLQIIHTRADKLVAMLIPKTPETTRDIALHFRRCRSRTERHAKPFVKPRPGADHKQLPSRLVQQKLCVTPNGIDHRVVTPSCRHLERPRGVRRRKGWGL